MIVVLLVVVELTIITNASGHETKEKVVFAKTHIDKNTVITGEMLELGEVGTAAVHPDALKSVDAVVSKMAGMDIVVGEMLLGTKLADGEHGVIEVEDKSKRSFFWEQAFIQIQIGTEQCLKNFQGLRMTNIYVNLSQTSCI